jgi:hypothetical protein
LEKFKEQFAWLGRLPDLAKRVQRLERRQEADTASKS